MSAYSEQNKRRALRRKRRAEGRCTDCGKLPLAICKDGRQSVKCAKCLRTHVGRKKYAKKKTVDPVVIVEVDPPSLYDRPEFQQYADKVLELVTNRPGITYKQIQDALPPPRNNDWTQCALEWHCDKIRGDDKNSHVTRYFIYEMRRTPDPTDHNYHAGLFNRRSQKDWAYPESIYGETI